jgi:hypothetical protein
VLLSIEEQFQVNAVRRDVVATTGAELFQICQKS